MKHQVFFGDARSMSELEDGSTQLIVTSPPYWQLKDYVRKIKSGSMIPTKNTSPV
jgi:DNA modification methylase